MKHLFSFFIFSFLFFSAHATIWTVDSLYNAGYGSLRAAVDSSSNGDTIRFNPILISNGSDSIVLQSFIPCYHDITIIGMYNSSDTLIISGGGVTRAFYVSNPNQLRLDSVVVTNCINGGISSTSFDTLFIDKSIVYNCNAGGSGGAISVPQGVLIINNSVIHNNSAVNKGGGVYGGPQSVKIYNSIIRNNSSGSKGGGVYSGSNVIVENSDISYNVSKEGGGIYSTNLWMDSTICSFNVGCGVFAEDSIGISNSLIEGNYFISYPGIYMGGGIRLHHNTIITPTYLNGWMKITNSSIINNSAKDDGGGIFFSGSVCEIENSIVDSNVTQNEGGGLYALVYDSLVVLKSKFRGNNTGEQGGGIYVMGPDPIISVDSSIIKENSSNFDGGGVCVKSPGSIILRISNSILNSNTTTKFGGGLYCDGSTFSDIEIYNTTVSGNTATKSGGGLHCFSPGTNTPNGMNMKIINSTIDNNTAQLGTAGGIYCHGGTGGGNYTILSIITSTIVHNNAQSDGSGITFSGVLNVENSTIFQNSTSVLGAGIHIFGGTLPTSIVNITSSVVALNEGGDIDSDYYIIMNSGGNNIYSDTSVIGSVATDQLGADSTSLNLSTLGNYGGDTETVIPIYPSIAIDNGNPFDTVPAQNINVVGLRDVGSGESCSSNSIFTVNECDSYTWINGVTYYTNNNIATHTLVNSGGCDSLVTLNLTISNLNSSYSYIDNGNAIYAFTNTSTGNYINSHWAFGDGTTTSTTNPSHSFTANGTYVVVLAIYDSLVQGDSCISYFTDTINVTGVSNSTTCNAGWVVFADSTSGGVTVINSSTGTNLTYHWDFGDGDTSNLQFPSHTYASNGPFNLCLIVDDGAGCSDVYCDSISSNGVLFKNGFDINVVANYPLGIQNITSESNVKIYPNPTTSILNIEAQNFKITKIQILDYSGKVVKTITSNFDVVNVESLATGVYYLELIGENETVTRKFIKQ